MSTATWFDDIPTIGQLPPDETVAKLRAVGETALADDLAAVAEDGSRSLTPESYGPRGLDLWALLHRPPPPWKHTAHAFGYLAPAAPGTALQPIQYAGNIAPDLTLKNA